MKARSDGLLRLTKPGMWFLIFVLVMAAAATNTGNNGLFLVLAFMVGIFVVSHFMATRNIRGLRLALDAPVEVYANRPAALRVEIENRAWLPRWLLLLTLERDDVEPKAKGARRSSPVLVPHLEPRARLRGTTEITPRRRGRQRVRRLHITSLFPLGLFRKGRRYPVDLEILVYPELLATAPAIPPEREGQAGDEPLRRRGWGHELLGLRDYRQGDDPRGIHWKQTARTGNFVFKERETEENRRLMIVVDNAVGDLDDDGARDFERQISAAATAAVDYLDRGFEVALLTRENFLPWSAGPRQRHLILEALALLESRETEAAPLVPPTEAPHLCLRVTPPKVATQKTEPRKAVA